jgi:NADPH-dependent 2,4-dienoyl-CoA reductase/sulfur reductase-like enzyme
MSNKRVVIVGGVAGGASAVARARRLCEKCEIIVFERGPHVSFANCRLIKFMKATPPATWARKWPVTEPWFTARVTIIRPGSETRGMARP